MMLILKVHYILGIIDWPRFEMSKIDNLTRKLMVQHNISYKDQCHARLFISQAKRGMCLIELDPSE